MRVGAIVPVHGDGSYLGEALRGVLEQEHGPEEVVVVDDASPTPIVLPRETPGNVKLIRRELRGGPAVARDTGLAELDADWIALADADDVWEPNKIDSQRRLAKDDVGVIYGTALVIDAEGTATGEIAVRGSQLTGQRFVEGLFQSNFIPASSVLIRRSALDAVGGFARAPHELAEDWDLWFRLLRAGERFVFDPTARIKYRRHAGGLTQDIERLAEAGLAVHERHAGLVSPALAQWVKARDLASLARGKIRRRDWKGARADFKESARLAKPPRRDRATRAIAAVPLLRNRLGRRDPYR